jgi:hypothetical protein
VIVKEDMSFDFISYYSIAWLKLDQIAFDSSSEYISMFFFSKTRMLVCQLLEIWNDNIITIAKRVKKVDSSVSSDIIIVKFVGYILLM